MDEVMELMRIRFNFTPRTSSLALIPIGVAPRFALLAPSYRLGQQQPAFPTVRLPADTGAEAGISFPLSQSQKWGIRDSPGAGPRAQALKGVAGFQRRPWSSGNDTPPPLPPPSVSPPPFPALPAALVFRALTAPPAVADVPTKPSSGSGISLQAQPGVQERANRRAREAAMGEEHLPEGDAARLKRGRWLPS